MLMPFSLQQNLYVCTCYMLMEKRKFLFLHFTFRIYSSSMYGLFCDASGWMDGWLAGWLAGDGNESFFLALTI